jgi:hypothetical protein
MADVELKDGTRFEGAEQHDRQTQVIDQLLEPVEHFLAAAALLHAEVLQFIQHQQPEAVGHRQMIDLVGQERGGDVARFPRRVTGGQTQATDTRPLRERR